jgi:hypothetical protein
MGILELHPWGSRNDRPDQPDRMIFDVDPAPEVPWERVADAARLVRDVLSDLGLRSFLKTTGGKGLHVVVPLARKLGWDDVKAFSRAVAMQIAKSDPGATSRRPRRPSAGADLRRLPQERPRGDGGRGLLDAGPTRGAGLDADRVGGARAGACAPTRSASGTSRSAAAAAQGPLGGLRGEPAIDPRQRAARSRAVTS